MAVTRKSKANAAFVQEKSAPSNKPASTAAPTKVFIKLVNECSTYVTPEREVFYKGKIYPIDAKELPRFLSYRDDYGRRFFKQTTEAGGMVAKPDSTEHIRRVVESDARGSAGTIEEVDTARDRRVDDDDEHEEEDDDGVVRLQDEDGNPVGVAV